MTVLYGGTGRTPTGEGHLHPVEQLFADLPGVEPYPSGVVAPRGRIPGVAFFPGGSGLWGTQPDRPLPAMPIGGVMVLGHDFHSEAGFLASPDEGTEVPTTPTAKYRTPPTWINLRSLFAEVELPLEQCFFTNAYMGLRKDAKKTGRFVGSLDDAFVRRCQAFLIKQLTVQRPSIVLTLGAWVPRFIAPLSESLAHWTTARSMSALNAAAAVTHDVAFKGVASLSCTVVALTHPSLRGPNIHRRQFDGLSGHEAEVRMIREAMSSAGLKPGGS
jgi:hypothetical protein